jgi:hypothetical protein
MGDSLGNDDKRQQAGASKTGLDAKSGQVVTAAD